MKSTEKQELKRKIKRIGIFMLIVLFPVCVVCTLMAIAKVPQWLNIMVLVVMMFVLFFVYAWVCSKLDQKKNERLSKKKDPFSD